MITHIVMWDLRGADAESKRDAAVKVKRAFESLAGRVPGLQRIEVGIDLGRMAHSCDVVLYSEFADATALAAYADHPDHLRVRAEIGDLRIARHQVDYATPAR